MAFAQPRLWDLSRRALWGRTAALAASQSREQMACLPCRVFPVLRMPALAWVRDTRPPRRHEEPHPQRRAGGTPCDQEQGGREVIAPWHSVSKVPRLGIRRHGSDHGRVACGPCGRARHEGLQAV